MNLVELLASALGLAGIWFGTRLSLWTWPLTAASSLLFVYVYHNDGLIGSAFLNVLYFSFSVFGFFSWYKTSVGKELPVQFYGTSKSLLFFGLMIPAGVLMGMFVKLYAGEDYPVTDAILMALSIGAQYFMAKKYIESWPAWIIIDISYVWFLGSRGLWGAAALSAALVVLAVKGYRDWKAVYARQTNS